MPFYCPHNFRKPVNKDLICILLHISLKLYTIKIIVQQQKKKAECQRIDAFEVQC